MTTQNDHHELSRLLDQYCDGVLTKDAATWGDTWTDDGVWDLGRGEISGKDALVEFWTGAMTRFEFVVQTCPLATFDVADGADIGTGRVVVSEQMRTADGDDARMLGLYHDEYRRTADGWKFANRRLEILSR